MVDKSSVVIPFSNALVLNLRGSRVDPWLLECPPSWKESPVRGEPNPQVANVVDCASLSIHSLSALLILVHRRYLAVRHVVGAARASVTSVDAKPIEIHGALYFAQWWVWIGMVRR